MEEFLVLNEVILIVYFIMMYIKSGVFNSTLVVCILLIYIIVKMIFFISKNRRIKIISMIFLIVYTILSSYYINNLFLLFFPINFFIVTQYIKLPKWINVLFLVLITNVLKEKLFLEYFLILPLDYIFCFFIYRADIKIKKLMEENDKLKDKNYKLQSKTNNYMDYEKKIKYVSALEERNKIAQEIHDNMGHTISGSLMQLEAAKLLIYKDLEKSKDIIENTISVLRIGMEDIRKTLKNIKPSSEEIGINKIRLMIDEFKVTSGFKVKLIFENNIEQITIIQWKIICENIHEALTNIMKYSKASNVVIQIKILNKLIKVEVKDDGIGANNIKKGLGLAGIEERTAKLNGKVIIDGSNGFSIIILLPIE